MIRARLLLRRLLRLSLWLVRNRLEDVAVTGALALLLAGLRILTLDGGDVDPTRASRLQVEQLRHAATLHADRFGRWPDDTTSLERLLAAPGWPEDAWGTPLFYWSDGERGLVASLGADRRAGGRGEDADIVAVLEPLAPPTS